MPMRIVVVHDDHAFLDLITAALRDAGHEVEAHLDQAFEVFPPKASDRLELTIYQAKGSYRGMRIRVTGLPVSQSYAGALGLHLAEPATVSDVMDAVRRFGV
jgi:hypothetical protein